MALFARMTQRTFLILTILPKPEDPRPILTWYRSVARQMPHARLKVLFAADISFAAGSRLL
jgi:hypothetical protein